MLVVQVVAEQVMEMLAELELQEKDILVALAYIVVVEKMAVAVAVELVQ